jgi:hypothetical protein
MHDIETVLTVLRRLLETADVEHGVPEEVLLGLGRLSSAIAQWQCNGRVSRTLQAPRHGRWMVSPSGVHLGLVERPTMRRLVGALVEARCARPGEPLNSAELIAAGWPGESRVTHASANRLKVALCRLRHLGLEEVLVTTRSGWMLDPNVRVDRDPYDLDARGQRVDRYVLPTEAARVLSPVPAASGVYTTGIPPRPDRTAVDESAA